MKPDISTLSPGILIGLGILAVLELALLVTALVSLYRRPREQVSLGNKWIWLAIIVLVSTLGPILYFVLGRKRDAPEEDRSSPPGQVNSAENIADSLYGRRDDSDRP